MKMKPVHLRKLAAIMEVKGKALFSKNFIIMPIFSLGFTFLMKTIYGAVTKGAFDMSAYALALGVLMNLMMVGVYCTAAALAEEKEILVILIPFHRFPEPLMARGHMIENHIKHQPDAALIRLGDQLLHVSHRAVARIDIIIILHIIAIVILRRYKKRRQPDIVSAKLFDIIQLPDHPTFRKPSTRPPQIRAGISGAKISPRAPMIFCTGFWFVFAAAFTASLLTPSIPA